MVAHFNAQLDDAP